MNWNSAPAIVMLRVLINDFNSNNYTYADADLQSILAVSALYVQQQIQNNLASYGVQLSPSIDIFPDPSGDTAFTNFMVMKAACQADFCTFRTQALMDGISARCGPAGLTVMGHIKGFKELLTIGPCAAFEQMKNDLIFGQGLLCQVIMSPFIGNHFDPEALAVRFDDNRSTYYS